MSLLPSRESASIQRFLITLARRAPRNPGDASTLAVQARCPLDFGRTGCVEPEGPDRRTERPASPITPFDEVLVLGSVRKRSRLRMSRCRFGGVSFVSTSELSARPGDSCASNAPERPERALVRRADDAAIESRSEVLSPITLG